VKLGLNTAESLGHQISWTRKKKDELSSLLINDPTHRELMGKLNTFHNKITEGFNKTMRETVELQDQGDLLETKIAELNIKMRQLTSKTFALEKASGIRKKGDVADNQFLPKLQKFYEETEDALNSDPFSKSYKR